MINPNDQALDQSVILEDLDDSELDQVRSKMSSFRFPDSAKKAPEFGETHINNEAAAHPYESNQNQQTSQVQSNQLE